MATILGQLGADWTEDINLVNAQTIGTSASRTDDIDLAANDYFIVVIQLRLTFHGSATAGAVVEIFGSVDSGTTDDTIAVWAQDVAVNSGNTDNLSVRIEGYPYLAVKVTNEDGSQTLDLTTDYAAI